MKKLSFKAGLGVILALSFLSGCSNKSPGSAQSSSSDAKPAEVKHTIIKEPAKEENIVEDANQNGAPGAPAARQQGDQPGEQSGEQPGEQPSQANLPCRTEDDCALVPSNDCFGCLKQGGSHSVTTQKIAGEMWAQKQETCGPELKKFFEGLQAAKRQLKKEDMSQEASCLAFNGVACQQGQCVGALLNEEQLKARAEKMRQRMQQSQGQGQGQGQGRGQSQGQRSRGPQIGGQGQPQIGGQGGQDMGGQQ